MRSLWLGLLFLLVPRTAFADDDGPAYELSLEVDGPALLVSASIAAGFLVNKEAPGAPCGTNCNRANINVFDRPAAGLYSKAWQGIGNVGVAATILYPSVMLVADRGIKNGLLDSIVLLEAVGGASAVQVLTSYAVVRPRPRVYGNDAPLDERTNANASRSFFSGHVADTLAAGVAGAMTYRRLGRTKMAWLVLGGSLVGSAFVGVSRVLAGSHFPSDVLAGAGIGAGFGIFAPALHRSPVRVLASSPGADQGGISIAGSL